MNYIIPTTCIIGSICLFFYGVFTLPLTSSVSTVENNHSDVPVQKIELKPKDGDHRIVKMSNDGYYVQTYYETSFWHRVGSEDEPMTLEMAERVLASLNRKHYRPTVMEVIK